MPQIQFFALKEDTLGVLKQIEERISVSYFLVGHFPTTAFTRVECGQDIPSLGTADAESGIACSSYLMIDRKAPVIAREMGVSGAGKRFALDQLANPNSVILTPAGIWNEGMVLNGRVGTAHDADWAQALLKEFRSAFRKQQFTKIKSYYVGPHALVLLNSGMRFTIAAQSPPQFDLAIR